MMMFKRKIYDQMLQWKEYDGARALLIEGARFVGKTTVAKEFGEKEYKSFVYIDFETADRFIKSYFEDFMEDLDILFVKLSAAYDKILYRRNSLFIFDNVQEFPRARECIKHLVEDGRYDYIETGSLVSIKENVKDIIIPSEENSIKMYPLDFEEFCWALGNEKIVEKIHKCFNARSRLNATIHCDAMTLFEQYLLVGGMPQCVEKYLGSGHNLNAVENEKQNILKQYKEDINKITSNYRTKVMGIFDSLPNTLSSPQGRVVYKKIANGSYARNYENTFSWLEESMICNLCNCLTDREDSPRSEKSRVHIKCYMGDTGLLFSQAYSKLELSKEKVYQHILDGDFSLKNGMFLENAVSQMLSSSGYPLSFYTHYDTENHRNDMNIDFVITKRTDIDTKICPIEVKAKSSRYIGSMLSFCEKYRAEISAGVVISPEEFHVKDGVMYIPPYMACCL